MAPMRALLCSPCNACWRWPQDQVRMALTQHCAGLASLNSCRLQCSIHSLSQQATRSRSRRCASAGDAGGAVAARPSLGALQACHLHHRRRGNALQDELRHAVATLHCDTTASAASKPSAGLVATTWAARRIPRLPGGAPAAALLVSRGLLAAAAPSPEPRSHEAARSGGAVGQHPTPPLLPPSPSLTRERGVCVVE